MFDNSRSEKNAFSLVRAQAKKSVLFDARDPQFEMDPELRAVCDPWLEKVTGPFKAPRVSPPKKSTAAASATPTTTT
jgi:hypothetical protein